MTPQNSNSVAPEDENSNTEAQPPPETPPSPETPKHSFLEIFRLQGENVLSLNFRVFGTTPKLALIPQQEKALVHLMLRVLTYDATMSTQASIPTKGDERLWKFPISRVPLRL